MPIPNLTDDEEYIRAFFLNSDSSWLSQCRGEFGYLMPGVIFAFVALMATEPGYAVGYLWTALLYCIGLYVWRFSGKRWTDANVSLIKKYDRYIQELESRLEAGQ